MNEVSGIPKDWLPMIQWQKYHYKKQNIFTEKVGSHKDIVFVGGNGSGKSHILYWNANALALGIHPYQDRVGAPPLAIKVLMNDFEHGYGKIFTDTCLRSKMIVLDGEETTIGPLLQESPTLIKKWPSRDDKTLEYQNGSYLFFQTSEQKKKQHSGTNFDILVCDEEPEYQVYDESKRGLRTAKGGGRILHAFTPPFDDSTKNKGPTWTKFKLVDPFERGEAPDTFVVRASVYDNPAVTPEFIEWFSKGKSEEQLRIQLYGDYPTWGELIFPDFQDQLWNPKARKGNLLPYDIEIPWYDGDVSFEMALDWHGSKSPSVVWLYEYMAGPNKGDVVVFNELSPLAGKGMTISDTSIAIRELEGWRNVRIKRWGDPKMKDKNNALITGFTPWNEFRHSGIRLTEGWNRDPYVGYSIMNDFLRGKGPKNLEHPRLFIVESCKTLIHNMKNHYNVPQGDGTAKPDPTFSDYCVCLKYIMQNKSRKHKKNMGKSGRYAKYPLTSIGGKFDKLYMPNMLNYGRRM